MQNVVGNEARHSYGDNYAYLTIRCGVKITFDYSSFNVFYITKSFGIATTEHTIKRVLESLYKTTHAHVHEQTYSLTKEKREILLPQVLKERQYQCESYGIKK